MRRLAADGEDVGFEEDEDFVFRVGVALVVFRGEDGHHVVLAGDGGDGGGDADGVEIGLGEIALRLFGFPLGDDGIIDVVDDLGGEVEIDGDVIVADDGVDLDGGADVPDFEGGRGGRDGEVVGFVGRWFACCGRGSGIGCGFGGQGFNELGGVDDLFNGFDFGALAGAGGLNRGVEDAALAGFDEGGRPSCGGRRRWNRDAVSSIRAVSSFWGISIHSS